MELLESISIDIAFGDDKFECPFSHRPEEHNEKNEVPPACSNSSSVLGTSLKTESSRIETIKLSVPLTLSNGNKRDTVGFSPHHLIPGNEIWKKKKHPLHAWIQKDVKKKVKGDIGYINNRKHNGVDLPSHHKFSGWSAAKDGDQLAYAIAAMSADTKQRQFHDAHKAYSDMVWKSLEKISTKLDEIVDSKGCGDKNCPGEKSAPYDPPYEVLPQLKRVASRLRDKLTGDPAKWQAPVMTSRFGVLYQSGGKDQEVARQKLSAQRDQMGRPTDNKPV